MDEITWIDHINQWESFLKMRIGRLDKNEYGDRTKLLRQLFVLNQVRFASTFEPELLLNFIRGEINIGGFNSIDKYYFNLNESQKTSVEYCLGNSNLSLIKGPPGTGKTQVISEICAQLLERNPNIRILICSETHVAVNNILTRISKVSNCAKILRVNDKEEDSGLEDFLPNNILEQYITILEKSNVEQSVLDIIRKSLLENYDYNIEKQIILSANVVGMTCNKVSAYNFDKSWESFDVLIIDEVCKATLPEILGPILVSKKAILVGDPQQLPPVFCSEDLDVLNDIEKNHLQNYMYIDKLFDDENVVLLDTQYRMNNQIGSMISELFYSSELQNGRNIECNDCILWYDYNPHENWPQRSEIGHSKMMNDEEVKIISEIIENLDEKSENINDVAVIVPYKLQSFVLRKNIKKTKNINVKIDTVDGFQGKESDYVIFGLTRTHGSFKFLADKRRLNVALSRAKDGIFIVGSLKYARHNRLLSKVSKYTTLKKLY